MLLHSVGMPPSPCQVSARHTLLGRSLHPGLSRTVARATEDPGQESDSNMESRFAAELRKRKMLEASRASGEGSKESPPSSPTSKDPFTSNNATSTRARTAPPPRISMDGSQDQRQRSLSMVNEGLEGLPGRASQLIQLGGSIFLAFLPFMLAFSLLFSGVYWVFGDTFLHTGAERSGQRTYIDPQRLLSEPTVDPYVQFRK
mmetsp:Transcript_18804/g.32087  ORF Transcript_18804/g.32087 Transcript_18804/m.32087 type:complete len:202 (+) Transcript_18804:55-660(+)